jgi:hypothetical protein
VKAGDRVLVRFGVHGGEIGCIADPVAKAKAIRGLLLRSPTRDALLARLDVPAGHALVALPLHESGVLLPLSWLQDAP